MVTPELIIIKTLCTRLIRCMTYSSTEEVTMTRIVSRTDVIGEEVSREAFGAVAERRVVVCVATKDEQRAAEEHSGVQVPREAALFQNEPGRNV